MAKVKVSCPHCSKAFSVAQEAIGRKAKCSACKQAFLLVAAGQVSKTAAAKPPAVSKKSNPAPAKSLPKTQATEGPIDIFSVKSMSAPQPVQPAAKAAPKKETSAEFVQQPSRQTAQTKIERLKPLLLNQKIKTGRVSFLYRINILFTTLVMFLLPVVYFCIIGLVAYAIWYHASFNSDVVGAGRGRAVIFTALAYVMPIVGGIVLVFFMLKPLLASPGQSMRQRKLNAKGEPVLFWFVEQICEVVGSPVPRNIYIDYQINASAGFEHGFRGAMFGRNLTLSIGVPLVRGLNLQQFGGVLAHEFGHFSQGAGMRLSTFIRSINFWFQRVVFERDAWDEGLASLVDEDTDIRFAVLVWFVQLCVFASRAALWCLMMVGHLVSCSLLRQMEYDADKYEIQFSGSENFAQTSDRLMLLNTTYMQLIPSIVNAAIKKKTVKSLPKSIVEKTGEMAPNEVRDILQASHEQTTGILDTHPSNSQRIQKARDAQSAGVFHCTAPAGILFSNFEMTCEGVTDDFYRNVFGVSKQAIRKRRRRG